MTPLPLDRVAELASTKSATQIESVQSLWSGYGQIVRVRLERENAISSSLGSKNDLTETAIVKHVCPPEHRDHKYGWAGDVSHQRKLRSYENETNWYLNASQYCDGTCRVPQLMGAESIPNDTVYARRKPDAVSNSHSNAGWLLVMEDLDATGFYLRPRNLTDPQVNACLGWLASFHASFLVDATDSSKPSAADQFQLWPVGTYWHLDTRPDEFAAMEAGPLKQAADKIDAALNNARFQTLVHGDAKLANFCFSVDDRVAAVDFQYVGGGCGIKDVAYFVSSCFSDNECEQREQALLDSYFRQLEAALINRPQVLPTSFADLETEWRNLYRFAWADFYRFLAGWSPGHWKMHGYSQRVTLTLLKQLS